jgi:pimeloyl-ACP methyl ester carboxylesterase
MTALNPSGTLRIGASDLEYRMIGPAPGDAPTIIMLHEGLGSAGLWGEFPEKLAAATGAGVFAYSRAGYGASTPATLPRPLDYMHVEARPSAFAAGFWSDIPMARRSPRSMPAAFRITASAGWR